MEIELTTLSQVVNALDTFFKVKELEKDPAMSRFVPMVYNRWQKIRLSRNESPKRFQTCLSKNTEVRQLALCRSGTGLVDQPSKVYKQNHKWKKIFEPDFLKRFNGLMLKGTDKIQTVFTASFPHDEILRKFISQSREGDLLLLHHPIPLESGDPKGNLGRGFLPINSILLQKIIRKKLSIYSCHAPLDYNQKISTNRAITEALQATIVSEFLPYGNGYVGLIASLTPISTMDLITRLKKIFGIPYVDFAGKNLERITKIGIVAGGGDEVEYSQTCREKGAQAYITGEIFSHYDSDWGKQNTAKLRDYVKTTDISLIGVSHAASEFLVMKRQMPEWFKKKFGISVIPLAQKKWWL